jgi:hypothetical protein
MFDLYNDGVVWIANIFEEEYLMVKSYEDGKKLQ